ncbi:MAG TPA: LytTR family DNA-binding domain-containing protein [Gammaproteobacteria bacterium]
MLDQLRIERYWWRRFYAGWAIFLFVIGLISATSEIMENVRDSIDIPLWRPIINEFSGVAMLWLLIPLIAWFDARYRFRRDTWQYALPAHLAFSIPFALAHTAGFVLMRELLYPLFGGNYEFGDIGFELLYEYRKILRGYILVVLSLYAFRHYVLLRRLLDMPEAETAQSTATHPAPAQRFLARRNHREVVVNAADIDYAEAAGNYVILHTRLGEMKLRETMDNMERQLDPARFARTHRSHIVNLDAVKEIQPWFHGDQRLLLHDGTVLNLSRRYRDQVRQRVSA